jgi:hypothetical protein
MSEDILPTETITQPHTPLPFSVRALHDYKDDTTEGSIAIRQRDVIEVVRVLDSGWWEGKCGESYGCFPSIHCEVITSESEGNHNESHGEIHDASDDERTDLS